MKIENFKFGKIVVDGKTYTDDLIIFPDKVKADWWRKQGHLLQLNDIKNIIKRKPNLLIIGTGSSGMMEVSDKVKEKLKQENIDFEILKTKKACELFNKKENTVAALHLTC